MLRAKIFTLVLFIVCATTLSAQKSETGNWIIYFGNQAIDKKWNWHNEIQYRNYNFAGDLEQLLLRTGIGYNLSENNNNLLIGYGFIRSENYINEEEKIAINEHRLFQQFITKQQFGRVYTQHRYRLEERFVEDNDMAVRFRYFLGINIPMNKKSMDPKAFYTSLYNELFINGQAPVFDRNRIYGGIGYVISPALKAEVGFMSQVLANRNRNQFQLIFFNNLPFGRN